MPPRFVQVCVPIYVKIKYCKYLFVKTIIGSDLVEVICCGDIELWPSHHNTQVGYIAKISSTLSCIVNRRPYHCSFGMIGQHQQLKLFLIYFSSITLGF
jgi:hypothetical protein